MGKFLNVEKISIPDIPKEVRVPLDLRVNLSLGGKLGPVEGPLPFGDNYRGEDAPTLELKIVPSLNLKKNQGLQYTDEGAARNGEIYRQASEFNPFVLEGQSLLFGDKTRPLMTDPSLNEVNRQLENYVSLVPQLLGSPMAFEGTPILRSQSSFVRIVKSIAQFVLKGFQEAFQHPPFFFGGPFMIFMALLGGGSQGNGVNITPIDSKRSKNGQVFPVYDFNEYVGEKQRLLNATETNHISFEGYVRNGDFQFYVNEILTRGANFRIEATGITNPEAKVLRAQDFPESPERVKAFFVSAGIAGDEVVSFTIITGDRKTVREIYQAFFDKYQETGSAKAALDWLLQSPWSFLVA